jgi:hypothetical protein
MKVQLEDCQLNCGLFHVMCCQTAEVQPHASLSASVTVELHAFAYDILEFDERKPQAWICSMHYEAIITKALMTGLNRP